MSHLQGIHSFIQRMATHQDRDTSLDKINFYIPAAAPAVLTATSSTARTRRGPRSPSSRRPRHPFPLGPQALSMSFTHLFLTIYLAVHHASHY